MVTFLGGSRQAPMRDEICIFLIFYLLMILFFSVMHLGNNYYIYG